MNNMNCTKISKAAKNSSQTVFLLSQKKIHFYQTKRHCLQMVINRIGPFILYRVKDLPVELKCITTHVYIYFLAE